MVGVGDAMGIHRAGMATGGHGFAGHRGGTMDGFDVSTARISTAASGVDQVGEALNREIAHMRDLLADIGAGWHSSTAAPRFVTAMHGYLDQARALATALLGHGAGLAAIGKAFDQAEQAIADATPAVAG